MVPFKTLNTPMALSLCVGMGLFLGVAIADGRAPEPSIPTMVQDSGTKMTLLDTHFRDKNRGWTVGAAGTMLQTQDGGKQWSSLPRRSNVLLTAVTFHGDQQGWIVGQNGMILHSSDGGKKWLPQISGTNATFYDVFFLSPSMGWIVGARGTILSTQDGGQNWEDQTSLVTADLFGIQ